MVPRLNFFKGLQKIWKDLEKFFKKIMPFIRASKQAQAQRHCVKSSPASGQNKAAPHCNITFNRLDKLEYDVSLLSVDIS